MAANILDIASYRNFAGQMDQKYGLPSGLTDWVIASESSYQNDAYNPVSQAQGLGQFIPATAAWRGVDVNDPYSSIEGTASYLAYLHNKSGDWMTALTNYGTIKGYPDKAAQAQKLLSGQDAPPYHAPNQFSLNKDGTVGAAWYDPDKDLGTVQGTGSNPDGTQSLLDNAKNNNPGAGSSNTSNGDVPVPGIGSLSTNLALIILFFIFGLALIVLAFVSTDTGKQTIQATFAK